MKVEVLKNLVHDGKEYKPGDVVEVDESKKVLSEGDLKEYGILDVLLKGEVVKPLESKVALEPAAE